MLFFSPSFLVLGLAPADGADLQWNLGLENDRKRLKEHDFLENISHMSCADFMQPRSVSTGLGLSLDNTRVASTGDSSLLSLVDHQLLQQNAEIDRFLRVQVPFFILGAMHGYMFAKIVYCVVVM